jgi:holo-[acyl-carrier protein] synthase
MICGIGMDLVDIDRIARLLGRHPERARLRIFTEGERAYCDRRPEPARHFAARFAAKEAGYKALSGTEEARHIHWLEIEVTSSPLDGRPILLLHGQAAKRAAELGVSTLHVTLTHSDLVAAAVVVLESAAS